MSHVTIQRIAVAIVALAGTTGAHAQAFHELVESGGSESAYGVCHTEDGGYATAGLIYDRLSFRADMHVTRYDSTGAPIWSIRYGSPNADDVACSIEETPEGDFVVSGNTDAAGADLNVAVIRLDAAGNLLWARTFEGDGRFEDFTFSYQGGQILDARQEGDTFIVGRKILIPEGVIPAEHGGQVLRITPAGGLVFNHVYVAPVNPTTGLRREIGFVDVKSPGDGLGIAVVGTINPDLIDDPNQFDKDLIVARISETGGVTSSRVFGVLSPDPDTGNEQVSVDVGAGIDVLRFGQDNDFELGVAARASFGEFGDRTGTSFLRLTSSLAASAFQVHTSTEYSTFEPTSGAIREVPDTGNIVLAGNSFYGDGGVSPWMMLLDSPGNLIWSEYYLGQAFADAVLPPMNSAPARGFVLAGYAGNFQFGTSPSDIYMLRSDMTGRTGCEETCFRTQQPEVRLNEKEIQLSVRALSQTGEYPGQFQRLEMSRVVICSGRLCAADVNNDGSVDFGDFLDFFNGYDNLDAATGDINGDCQVDFADFLDFFNLYDTVCGTL